MSQPASQPVSQSDRQPARILDQRPMQSILIFPGETLKKTPRRHRHFSAYTFFVKTILKIYYEYYPNNYERATTETTTTSAERATPTTTPPTTTTTTAKTTTT